MIKAGSLALVCDELSLPIQRHNAAKTEKGLERLEQLVKQLQGDLHKVLADRSTFTLPVIPKS